MVIVPLKLIFNAASPLNWFWNKKYYQNEPRFIDVYCRDNLPKIKYSDIGTHWVALYVGGASPKDVNNNDVTYFDSFV